jgi:acyl-CoA reductase-like NAD-dependent aldehyde dehydrogenase
MAGEFFDNPNQEVVRADGSGPGIDTGVIPATGATAGIPGTWTPASSTAPASPAALIAGNPRVVKASPTSAWTTGQYVQTATASTPGRAYWNGTAWVGGAAAP